MSASVINESVSPSPKKDATSSVSFLGSNKSIAVIPRRFIASLSCSSVIDSFSLTVLFNSSTASVTASLLSVLSDESSLTALFSVTLLSLMVSSSFKATSLALTSLSDVSFILLSTPFENERLIILSNVKPALILRFELPPVPSVIGGDVIPVIAALTIFISFQ